MVVEAHDTSFYHNQILKSKYGVDNEAIKVSVDALLPFALIDGSDRSCVRLTLSHLCTGVLSAGPRRGGDAQHLPGAARTDFHGSAARLFQVVALLATVVRCARHRQLRPRRALLS